MDRQTIEERSTQYFRDVRDIILAALRTKLEGMETDKERLTYLESLTILIDMIETLVNNVTHNFDLLLSGEKLFQPDGKADDATITARLEAVEQRIAELKSLLS